MKKLRRFSPGGCFSYVYLIVLSVLCVFPLIAIYQAKIQRSCKVVIFQAS